MLFSDWYVQIFCLEINRDAEFLSLNLNTDGLEI